MLTYISMSVRNKIHRLTQECIHNIQSDTTQFYSYILERQHVSEFRTPSPGLLLDEYCTVMLALMGSHTLVSQDYTKKI
jgi:hypothetical protein